MSAKKDEEKGRPYCTICGMYIRAQAGESNKDAVDRHFYLRHPLSMEERMRLDKRY